ncbi:MAG: hypothetical protein ACI8S6_000466 [Myxococcota bacterium]|jgi:hypothetical protein
MRCAVCLLICLVGCEPMQDPGGFAAITKPVAAAGPAAGNTADAPDAAEPDADPALSYQEPVIIRSEDIQDQSTPAQPVTAPTTQPVAEPVTEPATAPFAEPAIGVMADPAAVTATSGTITSGSFPGVAGGWPLRVIKTMSDTNPPRAILGLPNGEEIVVTPGKMIPQHRLVVMSIGPHSVELAHIQPDGDHAAVRAVSLQTQY